MTKLYKAAAQALETLEKFVSNELTVGQRYTNEGEQMLASIYELRAALAEPEPRNQCAETCERAKLCAVCLAEMTEPVAVAIIRTWYKNGEQHAELWHWEDGINALPDGKHELYAAPQPLLDAAAIRNLKEKT